MRIRMLKAIPWVALSVLLVKDSLILGQTVFNVASTTLLVAVIAGSGLWAWPQARQNLRFSMKSPVLFLPALWWVWMGVSFAVHDFRTSDLSVVVIYSFQFIVYLSLTAVLAAEQTEIPPCPHPPGLDRPAPPPATEGKAKPATGPYLPFFILTALAVGIHQAFLGILGQSMPDGRATGSLSNPNPYAGLLILLIPLAWSLSSGRGNRWARIPLPVGFSIFFLVSVLLAQSRGAVLGLVVGMMLLASLFALGRRRTVLGIALLLPLLVGLIFGVSLVFHYESRFSHHSLLYFNANNINIVLYSDVKLPPEFLPQLDLDKNGAIDRKDLRLARALLAKDSPTMATGGSPVPSAPARDKKSEVERFKGTAIDRFKMLFQDFDPGVACRTAVYAGVGRILSDHFLCGLGPGNWFPCGLRYLPFFLREYVHSHSLALQWAVEMGFPGLLLWLALATGLFVRTWQAAARKEGALALSVCGALLCLFVHNLVDLTILARVIRFLFPALLACLGSLPYSARKTASPARPVDQP